MANKNSVGSTISIISVTPPTSSSIADQPQTGDPATSSSSAVPRGVNIARVNPGAATVAKSQLQGGEPQKDFWGGISAAFGAQVRGEFLSGKKDYVITDTPAPTMTSKGEVKHNIRIEGTDQYNLRLRTQAEQDIYDKAKQTGDWTTFLDVVGDPVVADPDTGAGGGSIFDDITNWLRGLSSGLGGSSTTLIIIAVVAVVLILILSR